MIALLQAFHFWHDPCSALLQNRNYLEVDMRFWTEKFQALAMAVTFAEQGEWDTAQELMEDVNTNRSESVNLKKRNERRSRPQVFRA